MRLIQQLKKLNSNLHPPNLLCYTDIMQTGKHSRSDLNQSSYRIRTQLSSLIGRVFSDTIRQTQKLLVVEEGTITMGWGAEIIACILEASGTGISVKRVAALDLPIPASGRLEAMTLPKIENIVHAVMNIVNANH